MFCEQCGAENAPRAEVCARCGAALPQDPGATWEPPAAPAEQPAYVPPAQPVYGERAPGFDFMPPQENAYSDSFPGSHCTRALALLAAICTLGALGVFLFVPCFTLYGGALTWWSIGVAAWEGNLRALVQMFTEQAFVLYLVYAGMGIFAIFTLVSAILELVGVGSPRRFAKKTCVAFSVVALLLMGGAVELLLFVCGAQYGVALQLGSILGLALLFAAILLAGVAPSGKRYVAPLR